MASTSIFTAIFRVKQLHFPHDQNFSCAKQKLLPCARIHGGHLLQSQRLRALKLLLQPGFREVSGAQGRCLLRFHPQGQSDWNTNLAMAANHDEKVVLCLQGYYADEEKAIKQIFDLNQKSDYMEFLLARLVNHQEIATHQDFTNRTVMQQKKAIMDSVSASAIQLVDRIAQAENTSKTCLWSLAALPANLEWRF